MGKKGKSIKRNCQAVSEAIGEVLMIAVVVIAFSSIAVTIFSDVAKNSSHVPHADLESTRLDDNKIRIFHVGGESIKVADMKLIINAKGDSFQFHMSDPEVTISGGNESTNRRVQEYPGRKRTTLAPRETPGGAPGERVRPHAGSG